MNRHGLWWLVAWVLNCVPAGALAGVGWLEFYVLSPPPPDGGFLGDLVLFGSLLALGQAPFVAVFTWFMLRRAGGGPLRMYSAAVGSALVWTLAGVVGWTVGSGISAFLPVSYSPVDLSPVYVLSQAVRWLVLGLAEGVVLATVYILSIGTAVSAGSLAAVGRARVVALFASVWLAWAAASTVGGLLFEVSRAGSFSFSLKLGQNLRGLGIAQNVADVVIPYAILIPILYGILTGVVLVIMTRRVV